MGKPAGDFYEKAYGVRRLSRQLDNLPQSVREAALDTLAMWEEGGAVEVLRFEAGRASLLARVFGEKVLAAGSAADPESLKAHARFVAQVERYARLDMDREKAKANGSLPVNGFLTMPSTQPDTEPDSGTVIEHDPDPDHDDKVDILGVAYIIARLPREDRQELARLLME